MFDRLWSWSAQKAVTIAGMLFAAGFLLFGFALYLGLHSVKFTGDLKATTVPVSYEGGVAVPMPLAKEVGFFLAPNWLLTGLVLLPLAIFHLLRARATIEPLIRQLAERGMIVHDDNTAASLDTLMAIWSRHSRWWSNVASVIFLAAVAFTLVADFIPVVLSWNIATPEAVAAIVDGERITLRHPTYEFDWSVASTFEGARINGWVNATFAFFAYLFIPMFGSAMLFAAMTWFFSTHAVFSNRSLAAERLRLIPDLKSEDPRIGFEVFEEFFSHLVRATFFTALIVVGMHLQNVFLRSPHYANIFDMTVGSNLQDILANLSTWNLGGAFASLTALTFTLDALETDLGNLSPQTYVAAVALLMLSVIVFGMVWTWLRDSAIKGRDLLRDQIKGQSQRAKAQRERLEGMTFWPLEWAELNFLLSGIVIVAGCMFWANFLIIVLAAILAFAGAQLIKFLPTVFVAAWAKWKNRRKK